MICSILCTTNRGTIYYCSGGQIASKEDEINKNQKKNYKKGCMRHMRNENKVRTREV